jgi:hypothetical protein
MMIKDDRNDWITGGERLAREKKTYSFSQILRQREKNGKSF